jgi:hypothetical protein
VKVWPKLKIEARKEFLPKRRVEEIIASSNLTDAEVLSLRAMMLLAPEDIAELVDLAGERVPELAVPIALVGVTAKPLALPTPQTRPTATHTRAHAQKLRRLTTTPFGWQIACVRLAALARQKVPAPRLGITSSNHPPGLGTMNACVRDSCVELQNARRTAAP